MEAERGREVYRECMKNHAATLGTYANDGCGEFTPDEMRPGGLLCGACGCHRNFHHKVVVVDYAPATSDTTSLAVYYNSPVEERTKEGRRRARTKFTAEQKAKMGLFSEKMGWRIPRREAEDDEVAKFCMEIGVTRQALKVWMHNHKSSASASSDPVSPPSPPASASASADGDAINGVEVGVGASTAM